jgi:hypothetical protein
MDIAPINLPLVQPQVYTAAAPAPGAVGDAGGAKALDPSPYQTAVGKTSLFAPFIYKNDHFTKTGSGQT